MLVTDVAFLLVILSLAVIFTITVFIWKGIVWLSLISGALWIISGAFFIMRTQEGTVILAFQEYLQLLLIGIGFAMFFSPMWLRAKDADIERNAPDDIDIWDDKAMDRHLETRKEREKREMRENRR